MHNRIRHFFWICGLFCRHAITLWQIKRYVVFAGPDGYPADTRKTNSIFDLWQIRSSDYPADTRKSIPDQEMWPSDLLAPRGGACARLAGDVFEQSRGRNGAATRDGNGRAINCYPSGLTETGRANLMGRPSSPYPSGLARHGRPGSKFYDFATPPAEP